MIQDYGHSCRQDQYTYIAIYIRPKKMCVDGLIGRAENQRHANEAGLPLLACRSPLFLDSIDYRMTKVRTTLEPGSAGKGLHSFWQQLENRFSRKGSAPPDAGVLASWDVHNSIPFIFESSIKRSSSLGLEIDGPSAKKCTLRILVFLHLLSQQC